MDDDYEFEDIEDTEQRRIAAELIDLGIARGGMVFHDTALQWISEWIDQNFVRRDSIYESPAWLDSLALEAERLRKECGQ